ncbi:MAG: D-alanyl-D-alanine carboxypeptidase family protein [Erysipelotrichaceae bacterium]|nr:D-alanyl-D-alanine carboxypeptidase family protein [Erysipelotrichaceae bacterium]
MIIIVCLLLLLSSVMMAQAEEAVTTQTPTASPTDEVSYYDFLQLDAPSAILIDAKSGMVLYEKNSYQTMEPASITKILTAYLVCENLSLDTMVTCNETAIFGFDRASSHIFLDVGEQISVKDLLYATLLQSANDASCVLAEAVSGSIDEFVNLMNSTIAQWGITDSHFANPHGLPDPNHYVSAHDMAMITRQCIKNKTFLEIFGTPTYEAQPTNKQPDVRYFANGNQMLIEGKHYYEHAIGGKTGYTQAAGYTMVTYAKNANNMELIAVVLGESAGDLRYTDTQKLFDYGFENYKTAVLSQDKIPSKTVEIEKDGKLWATVDFSVDLNFNILLPSDTPEELITTEIIVHDEDDPQKINAELVLKLKDEIIGSVMMDKKVQEYDISFKATTMPLLIQWFNYFCVGILGMFVLGHFVYAIRKDAYK